MNMSKKVLLIDDRVDDISWLADVLEARGYEVDQVTNEKAAEAKLAEVRKALDEKRKPYVLAIVDIMIPIMGIIELVEIDEEFFEDSAETGVRLCKFAREELKITEEELPIVLLTARSDDEEIRDKLLGIGIQKIFSRVPQNDDEDIRLYLERILPKVEK